MRKVIQELPRCQQDILWCLYKVLKKYPKYRYFIIQRKRPTFSPRDPDTQELIGEYVWIQGYAKSAKALVQRTILIQEAFCCYSVTPYGKQFLGLEKEGE
jgi:hypothetical protein